VKRLLTPLKPVLVPLWNGGHRLAWRLGEIGGAVWHRRFATCDVCGRWGPLLYRRWVVSPKLVTMWGLTPREAEALAHKESDECAWCGAKLRSRRLARTLLDLLGHGERSLRDWVRTDQARSLAIAEINRIQGIHQTLASLPALRSSNFHDPSAPGEWTPDSPHEDLMRLTYANAAFDLVLTSETLEHVPNLRQALGEIHRVLKPGGYHLFTVPVRPGVDQTYARATLADDGSLLVLTPPLLHHPGGDVGYPVFTEIGDDFPDLLQQAGFEVTVRFGPIREDDLGAVFLTRKPVEQPA
jgi:SAM-dependent methyltransferase